jgi:hypothetical protein
MGVDEEATGAACCFTIAAQLLASTGRRQLGVLVSHPPDPLADHFGETATTEAVFERRPIGMGRDRLDLFRQLVAVVRAGVFAHARGGVLAGDCREFALRDDYQFFADLLRGMPQLRQDGVGEAAADRENAEEKVRWGDRRSVFFRLIECNLERSFGVLGHRYLALGRTRPASVDLDQRLPYRSAVDAEPAQRRGASIWLCRPQYPEHHVGRAHVLISKRSRLQLGLAECLVGRLG